MYSYVYCIFFRFRTCVPESRYRGFSIRPEKLYVLIISGFTIFYTLRCTLPLILIQNHFFFPTYTKIWF